MNKTTLLIVLFILGVAGIISFIHYEMEQARDKKAAMAVRATEKETPPAAKAVEQPANKIPVAPSATSQLPMPKDNTTLPVKTESKFKSPVGVILDIGTTMIRETDKAAQEFLPPVTSAEEQQIGAEINKIIRRNTPEWKNSALVVKANNVFEKLLPLTKRKDITYRLEVLDDQKIINAYATAGGYIYITRALLERFNSDAAIALCIGHEIGHVELYHTVNRLRTMMAARKIVGSDIAMIAQMGYKMLTNCYTKEQEFDADEFGFRICLKAGFSREQMIAFLDGLGAVEKEIRKKSGTVDLPPMLQDMEYFLQGHPYTAERLERIKKL